MTEEHAEFQPCHHQWKNELLTQPDGKTEKMRATCLRCGVTAESVRQISPESPIIVGSGLAADEAMPAVENAELTAEQREARIALSTPLGGQQPTGSALPTPPSRTAAKVEVGTRVQPLIATDLETAWRMAMAFARSRMLPKSYYEGMENLNFDQITEFAASKAFTAMQIGAEVGLPAMASIQSIAVVNGMATIWGDTQKALVLKSGLSEYVREGFDGGDSPWLIDAKGIKTPNRAYTAWCEAKRRDNDEVVRETFSVQDAIDTGLWEKKGTWQTHKKRMLKYKARAFALRDCFPDVLKGLTHSAEEMEGEDMIDVTPKAQIAPHNPAEKLAGMLEQNMLEQATTPNPKEKAYATQS